MRVFQSFYLLLFVVFTAVMAFPTPQLQLPQIFGNSQPQERIAEQVDNVVQNLVKSIQKSPLFAQFYEASSNKEAQREKLQNFIEEIRRPLMGTSN